jgi:benzoyl-CoA-dihydrodiol lyase
MPRSKLDEAVDKRVKAIAAASEGEKPAKGIALPPIERKRTSASNEYKYVSVEFTRENRLATIMLRGPENAPPASADEMVKQGAAFWPLQIARELDDAILDIRLNELEVATIVFKSSGDPQRVLDYDAFFDKNAAHWLAREIRLKWKRVLKRVDMTSRSMVALIEPGSCFAGTLAELTFAADRSYMLIGQQQGDNRPPAAIMLGDVNFNGGLTMSNGLTRIETRFLDDDEARARAQEEVGESLDAEAAEAIGLVTAALDDIDWEDEVRLFLEERASFSPDGLTGLEANLRFAGPETMETKIFARLTAWQNWIFQRPNAVGPEGALPRYGSGQKPNFDLKRV